MKVMLATFALVSALNAAGQGPRSKEPDKRKAAASQIPIYELALSEDTTYQSIHWAKNNDTVEAQCTGDGKVFVWVGGLGPFGLTSDGVVSFSKEKVADVPHPFVTFLGGDIAVSDGDVYFRVSGVDDEDMEVHTEEVIDSQGVSHTAHEKRILRTHQFIAHFDKEGHYESAIKDLPFTIYRLGAFASGTLIAQGMDGDRRARMALFDFRGQLLHYLELPKDLTENPEPLPAGSFKPCDGCEANNPEATLLSSQFIPAAGRMLFFRFLSRSNSVRGYEIQESGAIRAINLKLPQGYIMDGFIPSDRNWLVRSSKQDSHNGSALFEIDPETGALLQQYRIPDSQDTIACFAAGKFWGVHRDTKEEQLRVVHAIAQPYTGR